MLNAFRIRNATRKSRISCVVAAVRARSNARLDKLFPSSMVMEDSLPILVDASEVGVVDIALDSYPRLHGMLPCGMKFEGAGWQSAIHGSGYGKQGFGGTEQGTPLRVSRAGSLIEGFV